ncbi:MAG: hypothetical protein AB7S54_06345 [Bacteroidales bacterium]
MKTVYQGLLVIIIAILAYLVYDSIMDPIRFKKEKDKRYEATIQRLEDIRTAELAYRSRFNKFTGSFDTLITFLKEGQFKVVKQIGSEDDSIALAQGKIFRDTILVNVRDSLFKNYPIDSLRFIPYSGGVQFELAAGDLETGSKIKVRVFECKAHNDVILNGLDHQEIININDLQKKLDKFPGLQVGSMTEATNNAGNWE